ncbi:MAG: hypothetical protein IPH54_16010 [Rhodoferax sp.]|jgi:hypothetical protein|nr:hypothetical protein [Rhodoferax sp.]
MVNFLKLNCIGIYAIALISLFYPLPAELGSTMQNGALLLLVFNAVEAIFGFEQVKLYQGPLLISLLLSLLFGRLHWKLLPVQSPPPNQG